MKTFNDLVFEQHTHQTSMFGTFGKRARLDFPNGYGVSVITGGTGVYASACNPYELAVLKDGVLTYDTPITDDVIGYCDEAQITKLMAQVQAL